MAPKLRECALCGDAFVPLESPDGPFSALFCWECRSAKSVEALHERNQRAPWVTGEDDDRPTT